MEPTKSDELTTRVLSAIERLHTDLVTRFERLETNSVRRPAPDLRQITAHIQDVGDVSGNLGEWIGQRGSRRAIQGFSMLPGHGIDPGDFSYQVVLNSEWLSPWMPAGKFCGSQGLGLSLRGFCLHLGRKIAADFDCRYSATFIDGSSVGPLVHGQSCVSPSLAPLEAFQIVLQPHNRIRVPLDE